MGSSGSENVLAESDWHDTEGEAESECRERIEEAIEELKDELNSEGRKVVSEEHGPIECQTRTTENRPDEFKCSTKSTVDWISAT